MTTKEAVKNIINEILSCSDAGYITEIYAESWSVKNGDFTNPVCLMVETTPQFSNNTLYDCINDIEERIYPFELRISVEPDAAERGHGITLWRKGEFMNNYFELAKNAILNSKTAKECLTKLLLDEDYTDTYFPFLIDVAQFEDGRTAADNIYTEAMKTVASSDGIDEQDLPFLFDIQFIGDLDLAGGSYLNHALKTIWEDV